MRPFANKQRVRKINFAAPRDIKIARISINTPNLYQQTGQK